MTDNERQEYLKKREIILEVLSALFNEWDMAEPLYSLVKSSEVTPDILDSLTKILENSFNDVKDEEKKEKLESALNSIKAFKEKEISERSEDNKNAESAMEDYIF